MTNPCCCSAQRYHCTNRVSVKGAVCYECKTVCPPQPDPLTHGPKGSNVGPDD